jgi:hypothetical protein
MEIDCDRCKMRGAGCQDCVVTVLQPRNVAGFSAAVPAHLGEAEMKALGVLAAAGMVPPLRLTLPGSALPPGWRCRPRRGPGLSEPSLPPGPRDGSVAASFLGVVRGA